MKNKIYYLFLVVLFNLSCASTKYKESINEELLNNNQLEKLISSSDNFKTESYFVLGDTAPGHTDAGHDSNAKRKIIYNARLNLQVRNLDTTNQRLTEIAEKYKGYVQTIGTYFTVIRVEAKSLDAAITAVSSLGKVKSKSLTSNDVTNEYFDLKIRLENYQKSRKRYLELLEKAQTVEEILQVEKELERLNGEIDRLKGKIKRYNHLTQLATITVNLEQKKKLGILGAISVGLYKAIKWLFVRN